MNPFVTTGLVVRSLYNSGIEARNLSITNKEYRNLTGVSETTALRDLEVLVGRGSIRPAGKGRVRSYLL